MTKVPMIWNGRIRGYYDNTTSTYTKKVTDDHWCRKHKTFGGIQVEIVDQLKAKGCKVVQVEHKTKTKGIRNYYTKFDNYLTYGKVDCLNEEDGTQIFPDWNLFVCPEIKEETMRNTRDNPTLDIFSEGKPVSENSVVSRNNLPDDVDADMICPTCHSKGHLTCGGELPHKYQGIFCYVYCITCKEIFNYIEPPKLMACSICRKCTGMRYYEIDGEKFPSVTSILDFLPVPEALARWKANPKNAGKGKRSMTIGTLLHYRIANYYARKAGLPPVPLELHPGYPKPDKEMGEIVSAMHSYFVEFDEKYHPEPLAVEQVIYHKVLKYAGTADFVCRIDGKVWLLDWKTTGRFDPNKRPYENYNAQMSAYQEALRHMGRFTVEKLAVIYVAQEGFVFAESPGDMPRFMEALKLCTGAKPPTPPK